MITSNDLVKEDVSSDKATEEHEQAKKAQVTEEQPVRESSVPRDVSSERATKDPEIKKSSTSDFMSAVFGKVELTGPTDTHGQQVVDNSEEKKEEEVLGGASLDPNLPVPTDQEAATILDYDPYEDSDNVVPMDTTEGSETVAVVLENEKNKDGVVQTTTESSETGNVLDTSKSDENMDVDAPVSSDIGQKEKAVVDIIMTDLEFNVSGMVEKAIDRRLASSDTSQSTSSVDERLKAIEESVSWIGSLFRPAGQQNLIEKLTKLVNTHDKSVEDLKTERRRAKDDREQLKKQLEQVDELYQKIKKIYESFKKYLSYKMTKLETESEMFQFLNSKLFLENFKDLSSSEEFKALKKSLTISSLKTGADGISQELDDITATLVREEVQLAIIEKEKADLEARSQKRYDCFVCRSVEHGPTCILDFETRKEELERQKRCIQCAKTGCHADSPRCPRRDDPCKQCIGRFGRDDVKSRLHHPEICPVICDKQRAHIENAKAAQINRDSEQQKKMSKRPLSSGKGKKPQGRAPAAKRQKTGTEQKAHGTGVSVPAGRVPILGDTDYQSTSGSSKPN